ncbi:hypothetical protein ICA_00933 [Bacillus cereus BAG1O-3]|uniref:hypothetical protein n=1 Tax=Bacillus TaxID=1386 RepID=UPI000352EEBC|nr:MULTISPECIES: hypothetical protein [Bacillus]EPF14531.1 hypothetical protein ICA_00933 [Bacillus cereus BAG1O-3]MDR4412940.1 hypothetical protein [Bacillus thuringiensis]PEQ59123.1 hypothetical protein CN474_31765 [Bacillus thuringiensis]PFG76841.1 hypothetical protein DL97_4094 [Bacillus sp. YF23]PGH68022.1 hypothetical protein CN894_24880 [Bacillus thuringiensis]
MLVLIKRNFSLLRNKNYLAVCVLLISFLLLLKINGYGYVDIFKGMPVLDNISFFDMPFSWLLFQWIPYLLFLELFAGIIFTLDKYLLGRVKANRILFIANYLSFFLLFLLYHLLVFFCTSTFTKLEFYLILFNLITTSLLSLFSFCLLFFLRSIYVFVCISCIYFFAVIQYRFFPVINHTMFERMGFLWKMEDTLIVTAFVVFLILLSVRISKFYFRERRFL